MKSRTGEDLGLEASINNLGSFSDMDYQIAYRDLRRFIGLNEMQCSPSFDWHWGKQNDMTPPPGFSQFSGFTAASATVSTVPVPVPHQSVWVWSLKLQLQI